MTTMTSAEIEQYRGAVEAEMGDLRPEVRDDLLEDLGSHLTEVAAEGDGSLVERLGDPRAYAAELRSAAGLALAQPTEDQPAERFTELLRSGREAISRFDAASGTLVGYPRLRDCLQALRPAWWVLRGWVIAQIVARPGDSGHRAIPELGNSGTHSARFAGAVVLLACIAASIWFGRRTHRFGPGGRRAGLVVSVLLGLYGAVLLVHTGSVSYQFVDNGSVQPASGAFDGVTDLYVYDSAGHLVPGARLYDQNGIGLQVGQTACNNGRPRTDAGGNIVYAYPLCVQDREPFSGGPGALDTAAASVGSSGQAVPATSAPAPAVPATSAPAPATPAPATPAPATSGAVTSAATSKAPLSPSASSAPGAKPGSTASAHPGATP